MAGHESYKAHKWSQVVVQPPPVGRDRNMGQGVT